jgi:formate hydrogenlyase transcriptional activator
MAKTNNVTPVDSAHSDQSGYAGDEPESERARCREIVDSLQAIVWKCNPQTFQFTFVSRYAETLLGYPVERWLEEPTFWRDHIYAEDREFALECRSNAETGQPYDMEYRLIASDGRALWVRELGQMRDSHNDTPELEGVIVDLSEKRSSTEALSERKRWLRQLIDVIPQQIWSISADGKMDFCNARWREELGLTLEEAQGDGWHRILHPEEKTRLLQAWEESVRTGKPYEVRHRHRMADGSFRWFLCRSIPLLDEQGHILRWLGSSTDIQDQKEAEEALRKSEQRWRGVFDNSRVGVALQDGSLRYIDANAAFVKMLGYGLDELRTITCLEITHEEDVERYKSCIDEMMTGKRDHFEIEKRYIRKDGEVIWARLNGSIIGGGQSDLWVVMAEDITERKRAEQALANSEQRWRAAFENSSVGITLTDQTGHFIVSNAAFENMVGYRNDELKQMSYLELTCEEDRANCLTLYTELWEGKRERIQMEKRFCTKNRGVIWIRTNGSLVRQEGEARFAIFVVEEITEQKRLHDELQRERDRLRLLLELNHHFVSKLEIREFFAAVANGLNQVEGWKSATILLPDASGRRLQDYLNAGNLKPAEERLSLPIEGTMSGKVFRSGQPAIFRFEDLPALSPVYAETPSFREIVANEGWQAACILPLKHDGRVLGVLYLATPRDRESAEHDLHFLEELAKLISAALSNALRYEKISESNERLENEKVYIEDQIRQEFNFEEIIGASTQLRNVLQQVEVVAKTDSTVLVLGETGTGKELIARAIHNRSPRHNQSFIKVDCAAIPPSLMESELFGYERGAFTGAVANKPGRFEIADKGTLFLDEIGDLPLNLQTKLLRLLQDQTFERLGSNRTRQLDVRIITATNRDLETMVEKGEFRADLYYRLKVFVIEIPPLRERPDDIPPLVRHYVEKYASRMKKHIETIPRMAMETFVHYSWPGNVRELQHFIERAVILSSGSVLQAPLLELRRSTHKRQPALKTPAKRRTMEEIERDSILQALRESNWVVGGPEGAAAKLGLKRTTLASRMEKLGLSRRGHSSRH